ncbi:Homeodomain-like domain-containing protein [Nocardioides albertanoniae]|uniref:Homeodomain-like domain-containing protein n=1 Tax=Nocardioides albertanoniae TaxID=1175486 RepID=A0A543A2P9_9ACTN|nr:helix-turn-helix transcriptional regulator [Nocardioides albertanoniae]TQL66840.1 Homeodomain-like domain-containing protein [Nocardioides albertanoniae]
MEIGQSQTLMTALGFTPDAAQLYSRLLPLNGWPLVVVAATLSTSEEELTQAAAPLSDNGVISVGETLTVLGPTAVVAHMLERAAIRAQDAHDHLLKISHSVPYVAGTAARLQTTIGEEHPIDGEVIATEFSPEIFERMVAATSGDLLWLRPTVTVHPSEMRFISAIESTIATGRRCRGIYPLAALKQSPDVLRMRVEVGEEIRILPRVSTHLMVVGSTHAVFPDPLGPVEQPVVNVRQRAVIELVTSYFEELWRRALPAAELDDLPGAERRLLLAELASGAQDEQIARRLGVSLRTVRRRVAELLEDLDATSRFEAGAEAARRGWL